ncbi:DUF2161 family putative PD-(D/E)XK-type phosphodiesterase [Fictibacillus sp. KIGAM418]|uniref:DUF2161 family putative PD-(D/E)XK-type phosphodiesterase n=1 Tax=Fictibacillus marinisediminis TaxID=2878389 RepID=A0A9X2BCB5_9BACL|nr:DUF2161 family putative PD-(D/E)XK-type phosphodiesterase [Fictibacillus marinisediminis]MCK6256271.1 DUF2161 family putative PD-(D/E)XK-type phosphodiesterase [Fictibacillus marinisediminis]
MNNKNDKRYETDLYEPVRDFFMEKGFEVHGEVNHCDIAIVKEDELIIVELKLNLNVDLLVQATNRQRLTDLVYIAIPKPKYKLRSKKWQNILHLIRRLELGLLLVSFLKSGPVVETVLSPGAFDRLKSQQRYKKKRTKLLEEIKGRNGDYNVGGSNKTKLMTAYKENCIQIAYLLDQLGPLSPKALRELGTGAKTLSILNKNYYGWFEKIARGMYGVSEKGKKEMALFPDQVRYYSELLEKVNPETD